MIEACDVSYLERNNHCLENLKYKVFNNCQSYYDSFYFVVSILCPQISEISMTREREKKKEREGKKEKEKEKDCRSALYYTFNVYVYIVK